MTSSGAQREPQPFAGALHDLALSHRAAWLADVLPPGPCLLWGVDVSLATTLAADGTRTVLLLERTEAGVEAAAHGLGSGVAVRHAPAVDTGDSGSTADPGPLPDGLASAVIDTTSDHEPAAQVGTLLGRLADSTALVVVTAPGGGAAMAAELDARGRPGSVHVQELRTASCIAVGHDPDVVPGLGELLPADAQVDVVLAGVAPQPSVLLGGDAGPAVGLRSRDELVAELRDLDEQIGRAETLRVHELEADLATEQAARAELERALATRDGHIAELLGSTSWRLTAPVRWVSDTVRRR